MSASRDPYRELFERSADAILIIEGDRFVECNDATVAMLRYATREEVLSTHPSELSPPQQPDGRDSYEKANEMMAIAFEKGSHRFEWAHRRADGEVFPVEVLLTAVEAEDKPVLHVVWRDITMRRRLEEQLRHAHKMEAVGKLAGGIAHDFNNLLVVILGHADLLRECPPGDPDFVHSVEAIQQAGQRAAALVQQLLAFGRKQQLVSEVIDLNLLVDRLSRLLEPLIGDDLEVDTRLSDQPLFVKVDSGQIEQVIMNLASNARDACPEGGVLTIETGRADPPPSARGQSSAPSPGGYAMISVADSGIGMDPDTAAQAFDPFFTTKEQGRGTGLGLSTVYGIVQQSQGAVHIESAPSQGTTVSVYLPITTEAPSTTVQIPSGPEPAGGSQRILVVEDDDSVRKLITRILTTGGYEVVSARDGLEGLEEFTAHHGGFDLVVTDVTMPRVGGPEMIDRLAAEGHRPPVLFLSGYASDSLSGLDEMGEHVSFLEKPFSPRDLAQAVRQVLDRRRGTGEN